MQVPEDYYEGFLNVLSQLDVDPLEISADYRRSLQMLADQGEDTAKSFVAFMRLVARAQQQWQCGNCKSRFLRGQLQAAKGKRATKPVPLLQTGEDAKLRNETEGVERLCPSCGQNTVRPPGG